MKLIPLLLSTIMVQALSRKTQTRRTRGLELINKTPDKFIYDGSLEELPGGIIKQFEHHFFEAIDENKKPLEKYLRLVCPYGKPGDVFWVRETFLETIYPGTYLYRASTENDSKLLKWKPNIFMPKKVCRHFLKIKSIRAERLQDISESDAIAEGVEIKEGLYLNYIGNNFVYSTAIGSFKSLWNKINGKDSWNKNPWVWVIEFERISKPENFLSNAN